MKDRIKKALVAVAALGALAFGGSAIAQAAGDGGQPATAQPAAESTENAPENSATDTDNIQDENGKDDASEQDENGKEDASETEEPGSEVPGDDGPGGHADEPGNPNADHEFQGNE